MGPQAADRPVRLQPGPVLPCRGFCPSFVTLEGRRAGQAGAARSWARSRRCPPCRRPRPASPGMCSWPASAGRG
jgi:hypothetical protein